MNILRKFTFFKCKRCKTDSHTLNNNQNRIKNPGSTRFYDFGVSVAVAGILSAITLIFAFIKVMSAVG